MKLFKKSFIDSLPECQQSISEGDVQAFEELYNFYLNKLIAFSQNFTRSRELAEEVVEDVFVKLWCRREKVAEITNLNVYLYTAIKHQSLNALSKEARRVVTELLDVSEFDVLSSEKSPYDLLVTSEMMQLVEAAIDTLPPKCKLIFKMVREDQLKYKEIAEILNLSVNTIDVQMAIAVKRICANLNIKSEKKVKFF